MNLNINVSRKIAKAFPELRVGVVTGTLEQIPTQKDIDESFEVLSTHCKNLLEKGIFTDKLTELPEIAAWRKAYKEFGAKPSKYKPTAEATIRRVLKGGNLPNIGAIVNLYLSSELDQFLPIGGHDLRMVNFPIILDFAEGAEEFVGIGSEEPEVVPAGEVIYKDSDRVLTRRWNYKDCDHAKITDSTTEFVLMIEAPYVTISDEKIRSATDALKETLEKHLNGTFTSDVFKVDELVNEN